MKQICSNEVDLQQKLLDLESWLTDRGYKSEIVWPEIQKVNLNDRSNLKKRPKYQEDSITLVLTFHPALHMVFDILKRVHQHVQNSPMLKAVLPKPPRVVLCTPQFNQYKSNWNYIVRVEEDSFGKSWLNIFLITAIMVHRRTWWYKL